jgi:GNAT superfamily N-acetyltransferase
MSIDYSLRERVDWTSWGESPRAQDWIATLRDGGKWVASVEVVRAGILGDPYDLVDAVDELDGSGGTLGHIAMQVIQHSSYPLQQVLARGNGGEAAYNMLILDEIKTDPAWSGLGVTAMLVGTALQRLVNETLFIVTEPVPWWVKGKARREAAPGAHAFCESLGFVKYKNGLWVHWLDPGVLDAKVASLRERFGVPPQEDSLGQTFMPF